MSKTPTDIEIAQSAKMQPITEIAQKLGLSLDNIELYGKYKAKLTMEKVRDLESEKDGNLILITAITPTPAGEGKTTVTVGLTDALARIGKKTMACLREPSLGPSFGIKGGAAGGGYSQVVPMEDINLHFTGDLHAITYAHNLLAAMIDNHLQQGNELNIDPRRIVFRRVIDLNDRSLRKCIIGLGGKSEGVPRETGFDITVASEVMAILCLSKDLMNMKERFARIVVAYTYDGDPVTAADLNAQGAMTVLMKDAVKPNLVQTLANTPVFIHGGPFANIAHGCNSLIATKTALKLADYVVTEAGFGADLGAEKFFDLTCRFGGLTPKATVLVVTARALKMHGGVSKNDLNIENVDAVRKGLCNMEKHLENIAKFKVPCVVAVNRFSNDSDAEISCILKRCDELGVEAAIANVWEEGGKGGVELAQKVVEVVQNGRDDFSCLYDNGLEIKEKIKKIATEIYGADDVVYTSEALKDISRYEKMGYGNFPICMAKTQYSLSDDKSKLGRPSGFDITVREVRLSAGAGFLVCITGSIMTMPGLPKNPAACSIDIDENGKIYGLF